MQGLLISENISERDLIQPGLDNSASFFPKFVLSPDCLSIKLHDDKVVMDTSKTEENTGEVRVSDTKLNRESDEIAYEI